MKCNLVETALVLGRRCEKLKQNIRLPLNTSETVFALKINQRAESYLICTMCWFALEKIRYENYDMQAGSTCTDHTQPLIRAGTTPTCLKLWIEVSGWHKNETSLAWNVGQWWSTNRCIANKQRIISVERCQTKASGSECLRFPTCTGWLICHAC